MAGLERFVVAQDRHWDQILAELEAGRKTTHWMWHVFPQLRGLGHADRAQFYGLADAAKAADYLADPVLGARLGRCVELVLAARPVDAVSILGPIDALKLCSSMTLFDTLSPGKGFGEVLERSYDDTRDPMKLELLGTV